MPSIINEQEKKFGAAVDYNFARPLNSAISDAINGASARYRKLTRRVKIFAEEPLLASPGFAGDQRSRVSATGLIMALDLFAVNKGRPKMWFDLPEIQFSKPRLYNTLVGYGEGILTNPKVRGEAAVNSLSQIGGWDRFQEVIAKGTEDIPTLMNYFHGLCDALSVIIKPEAIETKNKRALALLTELKKSIFESTESDKLKVNC
jgi:hypothetical protein